MDRGDLEQLTFSHLSPDFVRNLMRCVFLARRDGWDETYANYPRQEADNLRGFVVRAKLEALMRDAASVAGLHAQAFRPPGQNWWHTEIHSGPVILTAATVRTPLAMVHPADYRRGLATSNQTRLDLFPDESLDALEGAPLYVLLLHSPSFWLTEEDRQTFGHLPGSMYLAYPASDLTTYVHSMNLFDEFPEVVREHAPATWSEAEVAVYVARSRRVA